MAIVVLALPSCATGPLSGPAETRPAPARPGDALAAEQRWLQSWFSATPVVVLQHGDGSVTIDVPRRFCFDPGRSNVKPALAAVLDKVAESLRRVPRSQLQLLAAPGDEAAPSALALRRAHQVRAQLLARAVPARQLGAATSTTATAVQLRIGIVAP